jgi:hypothetical protein
MCSHYTTGPIAGYGLGSWGNKVVHHTESGAGSDLGLRLINS